MKKKRKALLYHATEYVGFFHPPHRPLDEITMARGVCALAAFFSAAAASSMMPQLSKTAQIKGDGRLAAVACCGADRSAISAALGATKPSAVAVVEGSTTLALLDGQASVAEGALAVAASQVVLLEVRLADLTEDGPNGVSQAAPLILASATCP